MIEFRVLCLVALLVGWMAIPIPVEHIRCIDLVEDSETSMRFAYVTRDDLTLEQAKAMGMQCQRKRFVRQWGTEEMVDE